MAVRRGGWGERGLMGYRITRISRDTVPGVLRIYTREVAKVRERLPGELQGWVREEYEVEGMGDGTVL